MTIPTLQSGLSPELLLIAVSLTFAVGKLHCATRSASAGMRETYSAARRYWSFRSTP
jgi:hypothetical protein